MKLINSSFKILLLFLLFASCQKDDSFSNNNNQQNIPDNFSEYFGPEITRDFLGTVVDKNKNPLENVHIKIGNETTYTDNNGVFIIRNADVNQRFAYVKAEKTGYLNSSRSLVPTNGTNKVQIMLLEANVTGTVNSGQTETVNAPDGSSVSFDGNFINEDGTPYSGSVNVIMHYLDPTDEDMTLQMPGMLYAQNEDGAERMLQTLGMLAVELRGASGEDLNLAEGSTSEIKIPVDASLLGTAPATIPLWYFDEENGYWIEEGEAILQGDMYVGTVSHFSFWNCDIPARAITLCLTINDSNGNPLNSLDAFITSGVFGTRNGITNQDGEVCGYVPRDEILELSLYSFDECGESVVSNENIGPFTEDSNLSITLNTSSSINTYTISGLLKTCEGEDVNNGYAELMYEDHHLYNFVDDGNFEFNIMTCQDLNESTFELRGVNLETSEVSSTINNTFSSPLTNIGNLMACVSQEEYIQYIIDDEIPVFFSDEIEVDLNMDNITILRSIDPNNNESPKFLAYLPNETGSYITSSTNGMIFNFTYSENNNYYDYILAASYGISVNINYIGSSIGDYVDLTFSGTFDDQGILRTIEGSLHARIDE